MTTTLTEADSGTDVVIMHEQIPYSVPPRRQRDRHPDGAGEPGQARRDPLGASRTIPALGRSAEPDREVVAPVADVAQMHERDVRPGEHALDDRHGVLAVLGQDPSAIWPSRS